MTYASFLPSDIFNTINYSMSVIVYFASSLLSIIYCLYKIYFFDIKYYAVVTKLHTYIHEN